MISIDCFSCRVQVAFHGIAIPNNVGLVRWQLSGIETVVCKGRRNQSLLTLARTDNKRRGPGWV